MKITEKQRAFVDEYLICKNATEAYRKTTDVSRMNERTIGNNASRMLNHPSVVNELAARRAEIERKVGMSVQDVIRELVDIVTADPGELMAVRRLCCRHCHGKDHAYQWVDVSEYARAVASVVDSNALIERKNERAKKGHETEPNKLPSDEGGFGFVPHIKPHPKCPECFGEGRLDVHFADTRFLSDKGKKLFAGVKQTKEGLQILTRNQDAALNTLARALGMLKDGVVHQNPDGSNITPSPTAPTAVVIPIDPAEAARMYAAFMKETK